MSEERTMSCPECNGSGINQYPFKYGDTCSRCLGERTVTPPEVLLERLIQLQIEASEERSKAIRMSEGLMSGIQLPFNRGEASEADVTRETERLLRPETVELLKEIDQKIRAPKLRNTADNGAMKPPIDLFDLREASATLYGCSEEDMELTLRKHGEGTKSPQFVLEVSQSGTIHWESPVPKTRKSVLLEEYRQDLLKDLEEKRDELNSAIQMVTR